MNPIREKIQRRRYQLLQREQVLHLKRMQFLQQAKKQYLQNNIQSILNRFSSPQLMNLYNQVCEAAASSPLPHSPPS